jgi:hypothetical protein
MHYCINLMAHPGLTRYIDILILCIQILKFNENLKVIEMLKELQNLVNERS